ncbi:MAG: TolC family protein [Bacteroidota bacterium]|nr:TolC family protein [Bacteroidota bacterium]
MIRFNTLKLSLLLLLACPLFVKGQDRGVFTLDYCQKQAMTNFPSAKDKALLQESTVLRVKNVNTANLPQSSLNGQATYQSDAIKINIPVTGHPLSMEQAKDQYKLTLDVNQLLYDGGTVRYQRILEEASLAADLQQVDVDLYKIKEQVNNVYFLLLILQENNTLLNTSLNEIKEREKVVASAVKNGTLTPSDLDVLTAGRLQTEQQIAEIEITRKSAINILSLLMSQSVPETAAFELPAVDIADNVQNNRPEYKLFDLQQQRIDASRELTGTVLKPKVFAFAQAGYGRPGINMLSNEFNPYGIIGASLKWTFWDWHKNGREKQVIDIQKKMIDNKRETFDRNLNVDLQNRKAAVQKLDEALKRDIEIVNLRSKITKASASRLENGTITSTDYLIELNAETIAKINFESHKIQLIQAKVNYLTAKGL